MFFMVSTHLCSTNSLKPSRLLYSTWWEVTAAHYKHRRLVIPQLTHNPKSVQINSEESQKWVVLKEAYKDDQAQLPAIGSNVLHQIRFYKVPSNLILNIVRDGSYTTSLNNLFQYLTILIVKNMFLISSQNLPSLLFVVWQQNLLKSLSPSVL